MIYVIISNIIDIEHCIINYHQYKIFMLLLSSLLAGHASPTSATGVHSREIMMGELIKQPLLCSLPLCLVELGLMAESCGEL